MRVAASPFWVGVMTFSRMNRPDVLTGWVDTSAVLPRACTTVVKLVPSLDTWMSKSRVSQAEVSPPAPACRTMNCDSDCTEPRSTWRNLVAASEQNLSLVPPDTLPLTALSGVSLELHGAEPVAGRLSAMFVLDEV